MSAGPPVHQEKMAVHVRRSGHGSLILRIVLLLAALVGLYYLWPQLVHFFDAIPSLETINSLWFVLMLMLEVLSFVCYWGLMRVTLGQPRWSTVALIQMSSTAFSRVVPGGAASGGAVNYQMFGAAGIPKGRAATGVTAATLLSTAVLFTLPALALPAILAGVPVSRSPWHGLEAGLVVAVLIVAGGALALFTERPIRWVGRSVQRVLARRRGRHTAHTADLPQRLIEERDMIRDALGRRWWQALLYAAGGWLFDFAALLAALAAVGARPDPSLVLVGYVVAALLAVLPFTPGGLGFVEVGLAAKASAQAGYDAVIVLACVIRGDTPHFEYVSAEAARGVSEAALQTGVPVAFGVLTVETHAQAVERIGGSEGHKGREAAAAALDLLATLRAL